MYFYSRHHLIGGPVSVWVYEKVDMSSGSDMIIADSMISRLSVKIVASAGSMGNAKSPLIFSVASMDATAPLMDSSHGA